MILNIGFHFRHHWTISRHDQLLIRDFFECLHNHINALKRFHTSDYKEVIARLLHFPGDSFLEGEVRLDIDLLHIYDLFSTLV